MGTSAFSRFFQLPLIFKTFIFTFSKVLEVIVGREVSECLDSLERINAGENKVTVTHIVDFQIESAAGSSFIICL